MKISGAATSYSPAMCPSESGSSLTRRPSRVTGSTFITVFRVSFMAHPSQTQNPIVHSLSVVCFLAPVAHDALHDHPALGVGQRVEAPLPVKLVGVPGRQRPPAQTLQVGVRDDHPHEPL